jgi:mRNA-degrading endonuclease RelE of RelBE toxin-antitoxin system
MPSVQYSERFLKDLKKLKKTDSYDKIHDLCFKELPESETINSIKNLKKIEGYSDYFRIKIGVYRIGLKIEGENIILMRILHRKDIYRYFP